MKIKSLVVLFLLLLCAAKTSGQEKHCGFKANVWRNPVRTAILKSCGVLTTNADGTNSYVSNPPLLVQKPVTCRLILDTSGEVIDLCIIKTSGVKEIDKAAIAIIRKAAPFEQTASNKGPLKVSFMDSDVIVKSINEE